MLPINEKSDASAVNIEREIAKAYVEVLNRMPDPLGNESYKDSISRGYTTVALLRANLKSSPEYKGYVTKIKSGEIGADTAYIDKKGDIIWVKKINEEDVIKIINKKWNEGVTFVSTWGIKCGIATYTSYLMKAINKEYTLSTGKTGVNITDIYSINTGMEWGKVEGNLIHLQHEFGIMPKIIKSDSKMIVTFHSVTKDILKTMQDLESKLNIVGYIVHFDEAKEYIDIAKEKLEMENSREKTNEDMIREGRERKERLKHKFKKKIDNVYVIPHGSKQIANIEKDKVRKLLEFEELGIREGENVALVFGFQSGNKNFNRLIKACENTGTKIIVSGSIHECGYKNDLGTEGKLGIEKGNIIFLGRYLDEIETDLYALGSDILLFDYNPQDHYSCSGAMHRVIGSGRPCIVSNTNHFLDVREDSDGILKFSGQLDLEQKIRDALNRRDELGQRALAYAERTSWDKIAKEHLRIYSIYADLNLNVDKDNGDDDGEGEDNDVDDEGSK